MALIAALILAPCLGRFAPGQQADAPGGAVDLPHAHLVPDTAWLVIGVPDAGRLADDLVRLPVPGFQDPTADTGTPSPELAELERLAGYELTFKTLTSEVFSDFLLFITPAADSALHDEIIVAAGARNRDRVGQLLRAFDAVNRNRAEQTSDDPSLTNFGFEQFETEGVTISHFRVGENPYALLGYYCLAGGTVLFTSDLERMKTCLRLIAGSEKLERPLVENLESSRLAEAAKWAGADVVAWIDGDRDPTGNMLNRFLPIVPAFSAPTRHRAAAIRFEDAGLSISMAGDASEPAASLRSAESGPLAGARYISGDPVVGLAGRAETESDMRSIVLAAARQAHRFFIGLDPFGYGGAEELTDEALSMRVGERFGISLAEEVLPAMGREWFVLVNEIRIGPEALEADMVVGVEVRDRAVMATVMSKLERSIEADFKRAYDRLARESGAPSALKAPPAFRSSTLGPIEVRALRIPDSPAASPCYCFTGDGWLLISPSLAALRRAIESQGAAGPAEFAGLDAAVQRIVAVNLPGSDAAAAAGRGLVYPHIVAILPSRLGPPAAALLGAARSDPRAFRAVERRVGDLLTGTLSIGPRP